MADTPTRRDLLKPVQLLGMAFIAAVFGGVVTLVTMGFFQELPDPELYWRPVVAALVVAGISFIAVLLIVSLLLLAVDPAQATKRVDRPVLLDPEDPEGTSEAQS